MPRRIKSIQELRQELKNRQKQLKKAQARRKKLAARLKALDDEIAVLSGASGGGNGRRKPVRKKARRRPGPKRATGKPLVEYLRKVLANTREGMRAKDIVVAVRKAGYKTYSKDFYGIVAAALRDAKDFKRVKRGVYKLAK